MYVPNVKTTKFASTVLLSIRETDEQLVQIFLPKRYASVVSDEDIAKFNSRSNYLNLVYKGKCEKTKSYLLAIDDNAFNLFIFADNLSAQTISRVIQSI